MTCSYKYLIALLAVIFLAGLMGVTPVMAEEKMWEVRRPVDKSVLPLEYVRKTDEETGGKDSADTKQDAGKTSTSSTKPAAKAEEEKEPRPAATTARQSKPKPAAKGGVAGPLSFDLASDNLLVRVPTSIKPENVSYLNLVDPKRLAVDIKGNWTFTGQGSYRLGSGPVEQVDLGRHSDKLRIVFRFRDKAAKGDVIPDIVKSADRLVLTVFAPKK